MEKLALLGGSPSFQELATDKEIFRWPIITQEDKDAVMDIVENNKFSGKDITKKFEDEFAEWIGRKYACAYTNGTMSITAAMFAIGLGIGDEIICPTKTYWGSVSQAANFGASAVFCNINDMLSMDPDDLERCITPRTKAIVVVHYLGYPCDMDRIMEIANKHNLYVIEDCSHAHGSLYKGKKVGTFGHIAAMSMMSMKVFAAGELGMVVTDDRRLYERALAFGHYDLNNEQNILVADEIKGYYHIGLGGCKGRANQVSSALARGQLKHFDERSAEIRKAMNYFFDSLADIKGLKPLRCNEAEGSHMGGYYCPQFAYYPDEFKGLSAKRFCEALRAEFNGAFFSWEGANFCLHNHEFFKTFDLYNTGKPTRIEFADRDVRELDESINKSNTKYCISVPWFKKFDKERIDAYVAVYRKVAENYEQLLEGDIDKEQGGRWHGTENAANQQKKKK